MADARIARIHALRTAHAGRENKKAR